LFLLNDSQESASTAVTVPTAAVANQDIPYPDVARVSPEQAHISAMAGDAIIVDVRGQEFYNMGHARGAISLPLDQLPARFSELPKDKAVLFYCT
jgi:predicted sulfurtransferase